MTLPDTLSDLALRAEQALPWALDAALSNAAPIAGVLCLAALASEALPWLIPARDPRMRFLAKSLGIDSSRIAPVPDGVQLWHDAKSRLEFPDPGASVPLGAATLKGSYVFEKDGQLHLLAVHSTEDVRIEPDPEHPDLTEAVVGLIDHYTGNVHAGGVPIDVDQDCAQKASLIEAAANTRFGYRGKVIPLVLWKDPSGIAPDPQDERSISNLVPRHARLEEDGIAGLAPLESRLGAFHQDKGFRKLARWLRTQPRRTTPLSRLVLRAAIVLGCGWITATTPGAMGHEVLSSIFAQLQNPAGFLAAITG